VARVALFFYGSIPPEPTQKAGCSTLVSFDPVIQTPCPLASHGIKENENSRLCTVSGAQGRLTSGYGRLSV
jgi:hypothetical protein